ncbi:MULTISPECIES: flagellar hook-associated family protein [unclassified Rhizobium]|uniref:flagellar hook-associated family protein n=1 Tax=unclassified Rhizobium TaxID=2613769 RepID=UPI001ADD27BC|nr:MULTISPECIES: flagellar hook-associated family protein [unclassified Rhizobium]MBO9097294.1 flagellar hook-associated family protein [Rhizobium sp. L58/93]MBO9133854.1 flagellar hook-associated family protein [Rhizobium sp. B209b/85]MBO9167533.1 flagellar hook-associated family protein [Rhizobium sp. L245/93]MBO9183492.1 flagellar hook-associated family protein [Rhizobium sp. E27B/91]QXZ83823.1 flagellar hook-associated family protein [Rhizobium sp. K1/93]
MKLSAISSSAIQNAMRLTIKQSQNEMTKASLEATTGVYADMGVSLGGNISQSIDMTRDVSRLDSLTASNSTAAARMTATQSGLADMTSQSQTFLDQLVALQGNQDASSIALSQTTATSTISSFVADANTQLNGQYIFAGTNTDVQPVTDQTTAATAAIQSALTDYMAAQSPPVTSKSDLTADQMNDFISTKVQPMFLDDTSPAPNWSSWSSASDQNMTSRINNSEVIETSTNSNASGMRYMALSATVAKALMGTDISKAALNAVTTNAISFARQGIDGMNAQASQLGLSQSRVTKANDAISAQKDIINNRIVDLQGVDPYEASTKVNSLETQLQTAYTIVSKIQQLSLVNYL